MPRVFTSIEEWREFRRGEGFFGKSLGFVPTMGNLHEGHRSLLNRSARENDLTVLSIFVNPTQFDNKSDLEKYPRTQEADVQIARETKVDYILAPNYVSLYPDDYVYKVHESKLSGLMEGGVRPGHFDGMLTVVLKLLQLVKSRRAYFGEKDYQQLLLVRGMVDAFFIDTEIIGCPTIRDENGVALSSRNSRLNPEGYVKAVEFARVLRNGESFERVRGELLNLGIEVDYVEDVLDRRFAAVRMGEVRLIDNIELKGKV